MAWQSLPSAADPDVRSAPAHRPTTVTAATPFGSGNLCLTVVVNHCHKNVCVPSRPPIRRVDRVGVAGFSTLSAMTALSGLDQVNRSGLFRATDGSDRFGCTTPRF